MNSARVMTRPPLPAFAHMDHSGNALDALWRLIVGLSDCESEVSRATAELERLTGPDTGTTSAPTPRGFARDSDAWRDAQAVGAHCEPILADKPPTTPDLFAPAPITRYEATLDFPLAAGGTPPDGYEEPPYPIQEDGAALGWDEQRVLISCPRGVCMIPRTAWEAGFHYCAGC